MKKIIPGQTISHYRITEILGQGGMGEVYKAEDVRLKRYVALKFLSTSFSFSEESKKRLIHEAQAASSLDHPNICTIHEIDETDDGLLFISMAFYEGETLKDKISKGPIDINEAIKITLQICEGLEKAHKNEILHRDIKPANIFITNDGTVKILDFGLAKERGQAQLPIMDSTSGTVDYMSPEQAKGSIVSNRTDIWAIGVVLYEMITGQRPFDAEYEQAILFSILNKEPKAISEIDARLQRIISKALAKNPDNRYQSVGEIVDELNKINKDKDRTMMTKLSWMIAATVIIVISAAIYLFMPSSISVKEAETIKTVAVLPFANMSADPSQEYISDGIADELINTLSKNPKLRVTARTSSFYFKGNKTNIKTIAQTLNVKHLLEGSVRRSGNNLRISANLVNTETEATLWSNTYNGTMNNIFALQDSISGNVAEALKAALLGKETTKPEQKTDSKAYNLYLIGVHFYDNGGKEDFERAINYFEQALSIDSSYVSAWIMLAYAHYHHNLFSPTNEEFSKMRYAIKKTLELDPNCVDAYIFKSWKKSGEYDWVGAEAYLKHAMELEPNNANVLNNLANIAFYLGRYDEAINLEKRVSEVNPLYGYHNLGLLKFYAGLLDESVIAFRKSIELHPNTAETHLDLGLAYLMKKEVDSALTEVQMEIVLNEKNYGLALVYYAMGKKKESDDALQALIRDGQNNYTFAIAEIYAYRGENDKAFEWLERAYYQRDPDLLVIKPDPLIHNIRKDPRYAVFMKKMKLPM